MRVHTDWLLTPERAAVHLPMATAVIADLHLGYGEVRQRGGEAVPDAGLDDAVAVLKALSARQEVRRLVIAGDLFEDGRCGTLLKKLLTWLDAKGVELAAVVPGNHDRGLPRASSSLPVYPHGFDVGGWRVVHGDGELPRGQVVLGHWHPCFRRDGLTAACYLVGQRSLILPAFSPDAAGVNVLRQRRWQRHRCAVIAGERVLDFGPLNRLQTRKANGKRRKA